MLAVLGRAADELKRSGQPERLQRAGGSLAARPPPSRESKRGAPAMRRTPLRWSRSSVAVPSAAGRYSLEAREPLRCWHVVFASLFRIPRPAACSQRRRVDVRPIRVYLQYVLPLVMFVHFFNRSGSRRFFRIARVPRRQRVRVACCELAHRRVGVVVHQRLDRVEPDVQRRCFTAASMAAFSSDAVLACSGNDRSRCVRAAESAVFFDELHAFTGVAELFAVRVVASPRK